MAVSNIDPANKALQFIDFRVNDNKYRGYHSSQHNRYTMERVVDILYSLNKYAPNKELMVIRTTDISKRPENTKEEYLYAQFCNDAKEKAGIGTQDAMRKNIFVDFHRMGLIERFDKNKNSTDPFGKRRVKYVSISDLGVKLIEKKTILDTFFLYSKCIDSLLGGCINILLDILRDEVYKINNINSYEFMFFISAIGVKSKFNKTTGEVVELIKEYRRLSPIQRKSVIEKLKDELKPNKHGESKSQKRDFHNWYNETQQIFHLLDQTVYFEVIDNQNHKQLILKKGKKSFAENNTQLTRSKKEKDSYLNNHHVSKTKGFELHHIIPLSWSENQKHFKLLDKWNNMLYIDGFNHAKITQNKNRNVNLEVTNANDNISLTDFSQNTVCLKYKDNVLYDPSKKEVMKQYNQELLTICNR